ncbi:methylated-DNA--protein-cysteine methyltransferase [Sulfodiicoccus acidiphilus]|uniref:Methylated-DNA--protein-cysteine methyltransferase n=1 Tax=Sulfodiicoccus acidiphilus TaxID=1670455 RepID=A0A348B0H4_9CREN|nr:methylated-DNA--[protein]-cysteine S-methyltransferase [Sulfodiicoccus acidiphilus]BBD71676.1 methylated-DNA--protein-cysteine methyltransferase [Sulfodiicoccus acidiphilus]GGT86677.1 methylated-DNA--protein-cysteine methyltransferase [Sulfodiicoccus acidiphilus]
MIKYGLYESPLGVITVAATEKGLRMLDFCRCAEKGLIDQDYFSALFRRLDLYFSGKKVSFDFQLDLDYNPFRVRVFKEVTKIVWGTTSTYKEVAAKVGTSPRAVGVALSKNPLLLVIPCHRVVAENGLGGYSRGVELKRKLLELEGVNPRR